MQNKKASITPKGASFKNIKNGFNFFRKSKKEVSNEIDDIHDFAKCKSTDPSTLMEFKRQADMMEIQNKSGVNIPRQPHPKTSKNSNKRSIFLPSSSPV